MPKKNPLVKEFRANLPLIYNIFDKEGERLFPRGRYQSAYRYNLHFPLLKKLKKMKDALATDEDFDEDVMKEVASKLMESQEMRNSLTEALGKTENKQYSRLPNLLKELTTPSSPKETKPFHAIYPTLHASVKKLEKKQGYREILQPLASALEKFKQNPTPENVQNVAQLYESLPPRVERELTNNLSPEQSSDLTDTFSDINSILQQDPSLSNLSRHASDSTAPVPQTAAALPAQTSSTAPPAAKTAPMDYAKKLQEIDAEEKEFLANPLLADEKGTPEYNAVLEEFNNQRRAIRNLMKGKPTERSVRFDDGAATATPAPKPKLDPNNPTDRMRASQLREQALSSLKEITEQEKWAQSIPDSDQKQLLLDTLRENREAQNRIIGVTDNFFSHPYDDDTQSVLSEATSHGGYDLRDAIEGDVEDRDETQRNLDNQAAARSLQSFDIGNLPESVPGEHYTTTLQRWLDEKIAEYAASNFNLPNTEVPDSKMLLEAENRILELMNKSEKMTDAEKRLVQHFRSIDRNKDIPTPADEMSDQATRPISNDEVEQLMNPHIESIFDRLVKRSNRNYNEARDRRIREHERNTLGRFHGLNWNDGTRERLNREFKDDERIREREHLESLDDQAAQLLMQGNIEGWARARGMRDAYERGSHRKEDAQRFKNQRVQDALERNVMLDQSKQQGKLTSAAAAREAALDRMNRDQTRLSQRAQLAQHQHDSPLHQLAAAKRLISDGSYVTAPASFPSQPSAPPPRSWATNVGAVIQGASGAYGQQRESQARTQLMEAKNRIAQAQLMQQQGVNPLPPRG